MAKMTLRDIIKPKSDQLNGEDIADKPITIKITNASIHPGQQPFWINYEGDNGRPYKPCKTMIKILVHAWGDNEKNYIGRSMTLYLDPSVMYAGKKVGGIRISNLSDIEKPISIALAIGKGRKGIFKVGTMGSDFKSNPQKPPEPTIPPPDSVLDNIPEAQPELPEPMPEQPKIYTVNEIMDMAEGITTQEALAEWRKKIKPSLIVLPQGSIDRKGIIDFSNTIEKRIKNVVDNDIPY